ALPISPRSRFRASKGPAASAPSSRRRSVSTSRPPRLAGKRRLHAHGRGARARADGLTESTDRFKLQAFGDDGGGRLVQQVAEPHELGAEWMSLARDPRVL